MKKRYRFARDKKASDGTTHRIQIGCKKKSRNGKDIPAKLPGFLIHLDTLDENNKFVLDQEAMGFYGVTDEDIALAKSKGTKAPVGTLPTALHFYLPKNAERQPDGSWDFPGIFSAAYQCWEKDGLFCEGDGDQANRRQKDGTTKKVSCCPAGVEAVEGETYCPHSVEGKCKSHMRLIVTLSQGIKNGDPKPLSRALGFDARYRFETSNDTSEIQMLSVLKSAAERTEGRIGWISGTLTYVVRGRRRAPGSDMAVSMVGQVVMSLSEMDIAYKEQQTHNRFVEMANAGQGALPAPVAEETAPINAEALVYDNAPEPDPNEPPPEEPVDVEAEVVAEAAPTVEAEAEEPISIRNATFDQLKTALTDYLGQHDLEMREVAFYDHGKDYSGEPLRIQINNWDWFNEGATDQKKLNRQEHLRDICELLEEHPERPLVVWPAQEGKVS